MAEETLDQKINNRMNELERMMRADVHLDEPQKVRDHISTVSKFWSRLHEDDRDYIQAAQDSIDDGISWAEQDN